MKILHCLSQRPEATGSGVYIQAIISESQQHGNTNYLLAGIPEGTQPLLNDIPREHCHFVQFEGGDLPFPVVGMSDVMPYNSKRFCDLNNDEITLYEKVFLKALKKIIALHQPDIIHSHHLWLMSSVIKQHFSDIPLLISCHGSDLRQFQNVTHLQSRVLKGCQQAEAILALSQVQKQDIHTLHQIPLEKIHVIGGGYNAQLFSPGHKSSSSPIQLAYAGKMSRSKGVIYLLKALQGITQLNWHLHLIGGGQGKEKDEIVDCAKSLGDKVSIHGFVKRDELVNTMKFSHIFILPSFFEGLPLVLMEALASGCRLISTALPGVVELFDENKAEDIVSLVPLPRLQSVDQAFEEDELLFIENLKQALNIQISAAQKQANINTQQYHSLITKYSWPAIYKRTEKIYKLFS